MSVDKNKVVEYYLKKQNKVTDGVYTENILCGDHNALSVPMIKIAMQHAVENNAENINICLCSVLEYAKLKKKSHPNAEGTVAIRLEGKVIRDIERGIVRDFVERYDGSCTMLPRYHGKKMDVVLVANEEGVKAVAVDETNEQVAENSNDTTTKHILEMNYNSIPRDEEYIAFCNNCDMGMER